jgi:hypothetical protein
MECDWGIGKFETHSKKLVQAMVGHKGGFLFGQQFELHLPVSRCEIDVLTTSAAFKKSRMSLIRGIGCISLFVIAFNFLLSMAKRLSPSF